MDKNAERILIILQIYELLEYKCRANDFTGGMRVGTVDVKGELDSER